MRRYITATITLLLLTVVALAKSPELTSAKIYLKQGEVEKAREQLELAVEAKTGESEVFFLLGEYWAQKADFDKMNEMFARAAEINDRFYRKKGEKKINERRVNWWIEYFNGGVRCIQAQEWSHAIDSLSMSAAVLPDSLISLEQIAGCYLNWSQDDPDHQEAHLRSSRDWYLKVTDKKPDALDSWIMIAKLSFQLGEYQDALTQAEQALSLNPNQVDAVKVKAFSLVNLKRQSEAIDVYKQILELEPENTAMLYNLGLLYQEELGDVDKALEVLNRLYKLDDSDKDALTLLAQIYLVDKQDPQSAIPFYEKLMELDPDNTRVRYNLGIALIQTQEPDNIQRGKELISGASGN